MADQRLWIPEAEIYTYPDVMVIEGELAYKPGQRDTITNPSVIIEVLSESKNIYEGQPQWQLHHFNRSYANARKLAAAETGLDLATFPERCAFTLKAVLTPIMAPGVLMKQTLCSGQNTSFASSE